MSKKTLTVIVFVVLASLTRLLPHLPNFTPLAAIALFSGAYIRNRYLAIGLPLLVMLASDALMGFKGWIYAEQTITVYSTFLAIAALGTLVTKRVSILSVGASSLVSSCVFFLTTNFAVWLGGYFHQPPLYPMNSTGLTECFVQAIPFFGNTLAGDLFYNALLFGGFYLISINVPALTAEKKRA